jgi:2,6-dihydroxypyridine 3-monooxygenase
MEYGNTRYFSLPKIYGKNTAFSDNMDPTPPPPPPSPLLQSAQPDFPKVIVIGGSLGGLFAAIALRSVNCDVEVFEKSPVNMKGRGAGIVMQMEIVNFLKERNIVPSQSLSVPAYQRQFLRRDGTIESEEPSMQLMTSWELLYRVLRETFPDKLYHNERKMTSFKQKKNHIVVEFEENTKHKTCDLLIGADGAGSTMRHQLLPEVSPYYSGYVAWRGLVRESEVTPKLLDVFSHKLTFFLGHKTHILCCLIPGSDGELSLGKRRLNWVWYSNVPSQGGKLKKVLTDRNGVERGFTVPQGMVDGDIVKEHKTAAEDILPDIFQELLFATEAPSVQAIYDLSVSRMAFDRACLIGDASFVVRPHTAASTSKAAKNAVALAKSIQKYRGDIATALNKWESSQLAIGNYVASLGIRLGNGFQF